MGQPTISDLEKYTKSMGFEPDPEASGMYVHKVTGVKADRRTLLRAAQDWYRSVEDEKTIGDEKGYVRPRPTETTAQLLQRFHTELLQEGVLQHVTKDGVGAILASATQGLISHEGLVTKRRDLAQ